MHEIRKIDLDSDFPMLESWWIGHKSVVIPKHILPQGWLISAGGVDIAAVFLMLDVGGKWAVTEFLTTSPSVAFSRYLVEDIRKLLAHVESVAVAQGCTFIMSFIEPGSGEERMMRRIGYQAQAGERKHVIYAKPLAPS